VLPFIGTSTINIYKAVNETALLNFTAENMHETVWSRGNEKLLQIKDKKIKYYVEKTRCRCKVLLNGTLRIERLVKEDSGIYKVSAYDKNGKLKADETVVLIVLGEFLLSPNQSKGGSLRWKPSS